MSWSQTKNIFCSLLPRKARKGREHNTINTIDSRSTEEHRALMNQEEHMAGSWTHQQGQNVIMLPRGINAQGADGSITSGHYFNNLTPETLHKQYRVEYPRHESLLPASEIVGSVLLGDGGYHNALQGWSGSNPFLGQQQPVLPPPAQQANAGALVVIAAESGAVGVNTSNQDDLPKTDDATDATDKRLSFKLSKPDGALRCVELIRIITSEKSAYRADMKKGDLCSKGAARACLSKLFQDRLGQPLLHEKQFSSKWLEFEKMAKNRNIAIEMGGTPVDYGSELNSLLADLHSRKEKDDRRKGAISQQKADKHDQRSSALQVDALAVSRVRKRYEDAEANPYTLNPELSHKLSLSLSLSRSQSSTLNYTPSTLIAKPKALVPLSLSLPFLLLSSRGHVTSACTFSGEPSRRLY